MELQVRGAGSGTADRLPGIVDQDIAAEFENIDGVASGSVFGGQERSGEITYDKAACRSFQDCTITNQKCGGFGFYKPHFCRIPA